jgi:hypothetical protein
MKKVIVISAMTLLSLAVLGGLGGVYVVLSSQDRGMTADGRMAPPASVRNAAEAPKFNILESTPPSTTAQKPPETRLPTEFKLPTDLDIATPQIPEGLSDTASGQKN